VTTSGRDTRGACCLFVVLVLLAAPARGAPARTDAVAGAIAVPSPIATDSPLRAEADGRFRAGDVTGARVILDQMWQDHVVAGTGSTQPALAVLFDLGACHLRLGELGQARLCFERTVAGFEALEPRDAAALALALEGLTAVLVAQENVGEARTHLARAQDIRRGLFGANHPQVARLDALEGRLARLAGKPRQAQLAMQRARQAYREIHGNVHPTVAALVRNHTDLNLELGLVQDALIMARQADYITREIYGHTAPERVASLASLGRVRWTLGDHATAARHYRDALVILDAHDRTSVLEVAACETGLGRALLADGRHDEARQVLARAAEAYERAWWLAGPDQSRATFMASPYPLLAAAELLSGRDPAGRADRDDADRDDADDDAAERAWLALERHHGRSLWFAGWSRLLTAAERAERDALRLRSLALGERIERLAVGGEAHTLAELRRERADVGAALLALDARLQQRLAALAPAGATLPRAIDPAVASLGWLDVAIAPDRLSSWAWVLTSAHGLRWLPLPAGDEVGTLVTALRATVARRAPGDTDGFALLARQFEQTATRLYALRFAPCEPLLTDATTLVVVPGEAMAGVPLAVLRDDAERSLVERWAVAVAPRLTAGSDQPARATAGSADGLAAQRLLAVADPPFNTEHARAMRAGQHRSDPAGAVSRSVMAAAMRGDGELLHQLARLPASRGEVTAVAQLFAEADVLMGEDARKDALGARQAADSLEQYGVIHLATHALVDAERPELSVLVLSLVDLPAGPRDGLLSAGEIAASWRLDSELVTLSACETGLGRPTPGDGYLGFTQAFLAAGSRSVLASLWQVDDHATALLMERFYENLLVRRLGKAASLREAQVRLRDHEVAGRRPYAHPQYWSAFVMVGEP
jgi:CHAT domain-containing protein/tetratricopeptide (TPR) repeat protein